MSRRADRRLLIEASGMSCLAAKEMEWEGSQEVKEQFSRVGKPCWSTMAGNYSPAFLKWDYLEVAVV